LLALDRIWVRPRDTLLSVRAHRSPAARLASDHLPVLAEIALSNLRVAGAAGPLRASG
jgi:endonuclease/exonuclease/phosphatase family metal-dependent hydrolase